MNTINKCYFSLEKTSGVDNNITKQIILIILTFEKYDFLKNKNFLVFLMFF